MVGRMPLREFDDPTGERWRVWDTTPERVQGMGDFREGWLTFDNGTERRRLAPAPERWSEFPDEQLIQLLSVAHAPHVNARSGAWPAAERRAGERREGERREGDRRQRDS